MAHNVFRTSSQNCSNIRELRYIFSKPNFAYFSSGRKVMAKNKSSAWFKRFLSPAEEKHLYFDITKSFRKKLVEQAEKSHQSYSNIIEHALLASTNNKAAMQKLIPAQRLRDLPGEMDTAGKQKDLSRLQQLEQEVLPNGGVYQQQLITLYNRLIRAYLWSDQLHCAENVLAKIESQDLLPTTRTFTYLIKAYLEANQLSKAKELAERMQQLSLLNLKRYHAFDLEVMLRYHIAGGDTHAIDYLWRNMLPLIDTINPTLSVFTNYMDYLISDGSTTNHNTHRNVIESIYQTTQTCLHRHQKIETINPAAFEIWMKAAEKLVNQSHTKYIQQAEQLLYYLVKRIPSASEISKANSDLYSMLKNLTGRIIQLYITDNQDLKILAFYYNLLQKTTSKTALPEHVLDSTTMNIVEGALQRVEHKFKHDKSTNPHQISSILEGLLINV